MKRQNTHQSVDRSLQKQSQETTLQSNMVAGQSSVQPSQIICYSETVYIQTKLILSSNISGQTPQQVFQTEEHQGDYEQQQQEQQGKYCDLNQNQAQNNFDKFGDLQDEGTKEGYMRSQVKSQLPEGLAQSQRRQEVDRSQHRQVAEGQMSTKDKLDNLQKERLEVTGQQFRQKANHTQITGARQEPTSTAVNSTSQHPFAAYQNQPSHSKAEQKPQRVQEALQVANIKQQQFIKTKDHNKTQRSDQMQQGQALPVVGADSELGPQVMSGGESQRHVVVGTVNQTESKQGDGEQGRKPVMQGKMLSQELPDVNQQVSEIIEPSSVSANMIILEAQRQRIGTTLDYFLKYLAKYSKHTANQKQLIKNVESEIQKKRAAKAPLNDALDQYFKDFDSMTKDFYEKSYKYAKNDKVLDVNPMINMKEQLKVGIDELVFLRKSTGNQFNRLGQFATSSTKKDVSKFFSDYSTAISSAQAKNKQKKEEFHKKQKQLSKRTAKVEKLYTRGKQGSSQNEDLFVQMTKFITLQKQFRKSMIQYGLSLIPLKRALIKAEEVLYQELQVVFNHFKNQCRFLFKLHPKQFTLIEKLDNVIKAKNTFQKLSDITDADYVRSVLATVDKTSIQELADKDYERVLNLVHLEQIMGNSIQLLKGTTSKTFQLRNKAQQVVDTVSGNLLIFNKQTAQMKQKFIIKNIDAKIVQEGVVQIDEVLKGIIFDSNRTVRITFRDNDRAEELICFLNQAHESIAANQIANKK